MESVKMQKKTQIQIHPFLESRDSGGNGNWDRGTEKKSYQVWKRIENVKMSPKEFEDHDGMTEMSTSRKRTFSRCHRCRKRALFKKHQNGDLEMTKTVLFETHQNGDSGIINIPKINRKLPQDPLLTCPHFTTYIAFMWASGPFRQLKRPDYTWKGN